MSATADAMLTLNLFLKFKLVDEYLQLQLQKLVQIFVSLYDFSLYEIIS